MSEDSESERAPKRRRQPRKVSPTYLENSAAHYLGRFAASKAHLRKILMGKVQRSAHHHGTDVSEAERWVDDVIAKFLRLGYLDDRAFAEMRARGLHARGTPMRGIRFKLMQQGVGEADIDAALESLAAEEEAPDLDLAAAVALARRRRLGPYTSGDDKVRVEKREKHLATLARSGFSYDIAMRVIDAPSAEELELEAFPDRFSAAP